MVGKQYCVYIMTNTNNKVLYTGVTNNLARRVYEHKNGLGGPFTKKYNVHKLVYYEVGDNIHAAIAREKQLPLVDLRKAFIDYWKANNPENKPKGFLTYDGNHWTETGHKYVAEQMLKKFKL